MTTRRYHHGHLREALVDAAVETVRERGPEGLTMRELARRVGVSPRAAYRHFADRQALADVVAERALLGLVDANHRWLAPLDDGNPVTHARRRLVHINAAYVEFALSEPGMFRLLCTTYSRAPTDRVGGASVDPYSMLNPALDELVTVGYLLATDRPGAEVTCWSAVHGFAVLSGGPLHGLTHSARSASLTALLLSIDRCLGGGRNWPSLSLSLVLPEPVAD